MEQAQVLGGWVAAQCQTALDAPPDLVPLTGDAGFRRYFRVQGAPPRIAVVAPPTHEDNPAFVAKGLALAAAGVHVPRVFAVDYAQGFMLQEDLGDRVYLAELSAATVDELYTAAEATLLRIQATPADPQMFPAYSAELLRRELALFPEWFMAGLLRIAPTAADRRLLAQVFDLLIANAEAQPQVVVHRDYHARNLLILDSPATPVGVVDYQDAVIGPITYDLVSLLKDCYVRWPSALMRARALAFAAQLRGAGRIAVDDGQFMAWFDLMGLQRHLKVLGIFARLWLRDGKGRYLDDLPLVLRYVLETAHAYPQTRPFHDWFAARVVPLLPAQSWYRPWQSAGQPS